MRQWRWTRVAAVGALMAMLPGEASAQDADRTPASPVEASLTQDVGALSLEQLLNLEVESVFGASKFLQKITDAPASVTIVTASDIERFGWRTLADVLRAVRGFYVSDDRVYAYAGNRGFLRPGDFSTRLLLLVDGYRLNDNVYDQALYQEDFQIALEDVERIEVIRGPSSSVYGSNAVLGVVNIITRAASGAERGAVSAALGSLGTQGLRASTAHSFANGLAMRMSASVGRRGGNDTLFFPEFASATPERGVARGLDGMTNGNVLVRADAGEFSIRASYNRRRRELPAAPYGAVFGDDRASVDDSHLLVSATLARELPRGWNGVFRVGYDHSEFTGRYPYVWDEEDTEARLYYDRGRGQWFTGEGQVSRTLGRHLVTAGVEYRRNQRQNQFSYLDLPANELWGDARRSDTLGLFLQDEFRLHETFRLNLGLRYDRYANFKNPLKPRLAAIFQPRARTTLKFIVGEAFRAPNVFESYYVIPGEWKPRDDLRPETLRTVEGIVEHYVGQRLRVSASVFRNHFRDLISFSSTPDADGLFFFDNLDTATVKGLEAEVEAKWPSGWQVRASHTWADARDQRGQMSNSPHHLGQLLFAAPLPGGVSLGADVQMMGPRLTRTAQKLDGFVRPNVTIGRSFSGGRMRLDLTVSNASDTQFREPVSDDFVPDSIEQDGRTIRVRLLRRF